MSAIICPFGLSTCMRCSSPALPPQLPSAVVCFKGCIRGCISEWCSSCPARFWACVCILSHIVVQLTRLSLHCPVVASTMTYTVVSLAQCLDMYHVRDHSFSFFFLCLVLGLPVPAGHPIALGSRWVAWALAKVPFTLDHCLQLMSRPFYLINLSPPVFGAGTSLVPGHVTCPRWDCLSFPLLQPTLPG